MKKRNSMYACKLARRTTLLLVFCLFALAPSGADGWSGDLNVLLLNSSLDYDPHPGMTLSVSHDCTPVSIKAGLIRSQQQVKARRRGGSGMFTDDLSEISLGLQMNFDNRHPCLAGGVMLAEIVRQFPEGLRKTENGLGWWVEAIVQTTLFKYLNLGCTLRYSTADIGWNKRSRYEQARAGILLGFHL
jgi:hypothetical protein